MGEVEFEVVQEKLAALQQYFQELKELENITVVKAGQAH